MADSRNDLYKIEYATRVSDFRDRSRTTSKTILPDGTTVLLNACSKLTYSLEGWNNTRDVRLEGEAIFDVVHKEDKPFMCTPITIVSVY